MLQQQDSIHTSQPVAESQAFEGNVSNEQHVLRTTNDSVAQSTYATKSHWDVKVDSLLMPSQGKEIEVKMNPLPKYYKESYFSNDSLLHSELVAGRYGVAGEPVPYSIRNDGVLTPILMLGLFLLVFSIKKASQFFKFQMRHFFHTLRTDSILERESSSKMRYLLFAEVSTAMMLTFVFYSYAQDYITDTYITTSEYAIIGFFFLAVIGVFALQHLLQAMVNNVFFTRYQRRQWSSAQMMLTTCCGVLLVPVFMLLAYFGLSVENSLIYTLIVVLFVKILLIYKCFQIFFRKIGAILQIFLYFCTLEVIPLLLLWGVLVIIANNLKVNY